MIGAIIFIFCIPYIIISCGVLLVMLYEKISRTLSIAKRNKICYNQLEKQNILKEKNQKIQWIDDFRNGKQVTFGEAIIQCKNNTFIINGDNIPINKIQKLELKLKILYVWEETFNSYIPMDKPVEYISNVEYNDYGRVTDSEIMTVEEYNKKIESLFRFNEFGDQHYFKNHQFKFEKEYYISITFYNKNQQQILIGHSIDKSDTIPKELEEMFKEVNNYIFLTEEEKNQKIQWIDDFRNGKQVTFGEAIIQCKSNTFIINGDNIPINKIQKLEFTDKVSNVCKNTLDMNPYKDDNYSIPNPNWGKTIFQEKITLEQYENEKKCINEESLKYSYDIEKEYYLSITLKNGQQKNYLIGNSIPHYEKNEKLKEKLKEMINEVKYTLKKI